MKSFHKLLGQSGERYAERFLTQKGYVLVARNFRTKSAEIDLIFTDENTLIFVEVKTMTEKTVPFFGTPAEKVTRDKQRRIIRGACEFLRRYATTFDGYTPRFDVVEVTVCSRKLSFSHIQNAFEIQTSYHRKKQF